MGTNYDAQLQSVDTSFKPRLVLGSTGLKQHSGFVDEEFLVRLRGRNAIKIYTEMVNNSPILAAAIGIIKMMIRQVEWRVEPADESDEAKAEAEDTEGALEDMSHTFEDFLSEVLSMLWAGFAPFEVIYKLRKGPETGDSTTRSKFNDGKWGWRKLEIRAQDTVDRWVFDHEGGLLGMVQLAMYGTGVYKGPVFIPITKMLLFRTEIFKGNPEGKSLLRPAVIPYWYVKRIQEFEAIGIERNLAGMPIMEVPKELLLEDASPEDRATRTFLERFVTQIRMDERWGGLVPSSSEADGGCSGYKFSLMQSSGRKLVDTDVIIKRHRAEMLMLFLEQFLVMGTGEAGGNRALTNDMTRLFGTALTTTMDSIASVINHYLIPRRQRLNGVPPALDPYIVHGDVEGPKLAEVAAYIQALSSSGMVGPNDALERRLLEIGNLPQPPEDEVEANVPALAESKVDQVSRTAFSSEQVKVILDVNKALKLNQLDRSAAISTLALALGMEPEQAEQFIPAEAAEGEETPTPTPPSPPTPSEPPADGSPSKPDDGSDEETEPLGEDEGTDGSV